MYLRLRLHCNLSQLRVLTLIYRVVVVLVNVYTFYTFELNNGDNSKRTTFNLWSKWEIF
jgi:hypothetical protein